MVKNNQKILEIQFLGYRVKEYGAFILGLILLSLITSISVGLLEAFQLVFGSIFVLVIPGFFTSHIFYEKKKLGVLERLVLSFALSISVIPLLTFYLSLTGAKVSPTNAIITISGVILLSLLWLIWKKKI